MAYDPTSSGWTSQTDPEPTRPAGFELERGPEVAKVSATAAATASSGTITTAGVGVARVNPAAAITGVILQAGTVNGQEVIVANESAFSVAFATSATSNVADGAGSLIAPLTSAEFVWGATAARWFRKASGAAPLVSATAAATASSGTVTTAGVDVARINPAAAITGVILQAGTINGQRVVVLNEAIAANTATFAASGTSNVAGGTTNVVAGVQAKHFVWDGPTSLWYMN